MEMTRTKGKEVGEDVDDRNMSQIIQKCQKKESLQTYAMTRNIHHQGSSHHFLYPNVLMNLILLCNIDPTCLPALWLQSSLPLTVTPFLHHQLGLTKLHDGLAGLVLQQPAIEEFSMESTREEDEEVKEVEEVFSMQQMILIQMWERMIDMAMAEPKADGDVLVRIKKVSDGKPHMEWLMMRGEMTNHETSENKSTIWFIILLWQMQFVFLSF